VKPFFLPTSSPLGDGNKTPKQAERNSIKYSFFRRYINFRFRGSVYSFCNLFKAGFCNASSVKKEKFERKQTG